MKVFIVVENECEYNDHTYDLGSGGEPVRAFRERGNADDECRRLDSERRESGDYPLDPYEHPGGSGVYFKVVELEVEDSDVLGYRQAREKVEKAREAARALVKDAFNQEAAKLFAKYPLIQSFAWTQYTPYFNDGDECVFSVHTDEPDINGIEGVDIPYEDEHKDLRGAQEDASSLIASFDEDDLRYVFGDHVQVTCRRDGGVSTDSYEHD